MSRLLKKLNGSNNDNNYLLRSRDIRSVKMIIKDTNEKVDYHLAHVRKNINARYELNLSLEDVRGLNYNLANSEKKDRLLKEHNNKIICKIIIQEKEVLIVYDTVRQLIITALPVCLNLPHLCHGAYPNKNIDQRPCFWHWDISKQLNRDKKRQLKNEFEKDVDRTTFRKRMCKSCKKPFLYKELQGNGHSQYMYCKVCLEFEK